MIETETNTNSDSYTLSLSSKDDWELTTWVLNGVPVSHEVFLIYLGENSIARFSPEMVDRINDGNLLGPGYKLYYFDSPEIGCRVSIKKGWELVNPLQHEDFLNNFLRLI